LNPVRRLPGFVRGALRRRIAESFHRLFYYNGARTWSNTTWLGVSLQKCPLDLWVYQELLVDLKPAAIVECGTAFGGSAYFLASLCELLEHGEIITIDVESRADRPVHERLTYLTGSSTDPAIVASVEEFIGGRGPVLVLLDSDHTKEHVLSELRLYGPLVTPGSYLVVEDSNVNGHPVLPDFGPGPMEAIEEFLKADADFSVDRSREKYFLTFNPSGYLRKTG
jgi:cephalosporin hydroxylase